VSPSTHRSAKGCNLLPRSTPCNKTPKDHSACSANFFWSFKSSTAVAGQLQTRKEKKKYSQQQQLQWQVFIHAAAVVHLCCDVLLLQMMHAAVLPDYQ
jgi:hypothetical protein